MFVFKCIYLFWLALAAYILSSISPIMPSLCANMQVMKNGLVIQSGIYHELLASCSDFSDLVAAHQSSMEMTGEEGCQVQNTESSQPAKSGDENCETAIAPSKDSGSSKLIQEEEKETGRVSWRVYKLYMTQAWGWWGVLTFLTVSLLSEGFTMASNYWLSYETSGGPVFDTSVFLTVYVLIVAATILFQMISTLVVTFSGLKSSQAFFTKMFDSILRAPMSFFDTTPSGRILSRVCILCLISHRFTLLCPMDLIICPSNGVNLLPFSGISGPTKN